MKMIFALMTFPLVALGAAEKTKITSEKMVVPQTSSKMFQTKKMSEKTAYISTDLAALASQKGQVAVEVYQGDHFSAGFSILSSSDKVTEKIDGEDRKVTKNTSTYGVGGTYYLLDHSTSKNLFGSAQLLFSNDSTPTKTDNKTGLGIKLGGSVRMTESLTFNGGLFVHNLKDNFNGEPTLGLALVF